MTREEAIHHELLCVSEVPLHLHEGLARYLAEGVPTGSFLEAVLSNDLLGAVAHGDDDSRRAIAAIVQWLYAYAPARAWGSPDNVIAWRAEYARVERETCTGTL